MAHSSDLPTLPTLPAQPGAMEAAALQSLLGSDLFAEWVKQLDLTVLAVQPDTVVLALPVTAKHVHGGGVLCGQTMMAAADTAMVLAISAQLGAFRPMTTVQLQTSFLRPIAAPAAGASAQVQVTARVLRSGKSLVFGEIELHDAAGRLAAHATTTYALL